MEISIGITGQLMSESYPEIDGGGFMGDKGKKDKEKNKKHKKGKK